MAGLWCERAGVVNIAIEGMMLGSAGVGFTVYATLGNGNEAHWLWISIGVAILTGGLIAALHAVVSVSFLVLMDHLRRRDQPARHRDHRFPAFRAHRAVRHGILFGLNLDVALPLLSSLPILGDQVFTNKPIFFSMFVVVVLSWFILWRTKFGLRIRSVGENPHAAETLGVNVIKMRYQAVIIGGLIAGLAGAWFSMEAQGGFQDNMTNGAGFIALAALIFGKWRPSTAFLGAMLFGFTRALGSRLQILGVEVGDFEIPSELWQSLPFVVTIIVVAGAVGRAMPPAADGVPYEPSR